MSELKKQAVLVLGCGVSRAQRVKVAANVDQVGDNFEDNFEDVWTIDQSPTAMAKILWDLEDLHWPVPNNFFDEVHAYEVLEHLGGMGDYKFFFSLWKKIWDVLVPGGIVCATTPWWESAWAWQDPGHRRVYSPNMLGYLQQKKYEAEVGKTPMTDYRDIFPPPYSFIPRYAVMTNGGKPLADGSPDPKEAGFCFVLEKEIYEVPNGNS